MCDRLSLEEIDSRNSDALTLLSLLNATFATALTKGIPFCEDIVRSRIEYWWPHATYMHLSKESMVRNFPGEPRPECDRTGIHGEMGGGERDRGGFEVKLRALREGVVNPFVESLFTRHIVN